VITGSDIVVDVSVMQGLPNCLNASIHRSQRAPSRRYRERIHYAYMNATVSDSESDC
jgi:hypothetical protein